MLTVYKMVTASRWRFVLFVCAAISSGQVMASQEVMSKMTKGFSTVIEICKKELGVGDHIIQDFYNFWREDYQLVNSDLGCMVICMASKLDLLTEDNNMHHGNAHEFAKNHGADDDMAKRLVTILHECENTHASVDDPCNRALEIAKCFRSKIHELKWAPNMEIILEEVMTET